MGIGRDAGARPLGWMLAGVVAWGFVAGAAAGCSKKEEAAESVRPPSKGDGRSKSDERVVPSEYDGATSAATAAPSARAGSGDALPSRPGAGQGETPLDSVALPSAADCVRQCVDRNGMRAASVDQQRADCQQSCREQCVERCDRLGETRSGGFADACRQDCARQVGDEP